MKLEHRIHVLLPREMSLSNSCKDYLLNDSPQMTCQQDLHVSWYLKPYNEHNIDVSKFPVRPYISHSVEIEQGKESMIGS